LHVEVRGDPGQPAVLLVPGAGGDHLSLLQQAQALVAASFCTVALDPRGCGRSDKPDKGYDVPTLADDLLAVLDGLGIARAHVFGHSLGSVTALLAAARAPERFWSVAAASPWPRTDLFLRTFFSLVVEVIRTFPPERYGPWLLTFLASPGYLQDPERMAGMARSMFLGYRALPPDLLARHLSAGWDLDLAPLLPRLELPVLVLAAADDRMIPSAYSAQVAELLPRARQRVFTEPGASHMFTFELAQSVNAELAAFFRAHTGGV
jgi:pimeloyl-ACP methyl ester carboxylesterase